MAKPNYSFEKRQRELAKKRKKEDKAREKADRKTGDGTDAEPGGDAENPQQADAAQAPAGPVTSA